MKILIALSSLLLMSSAFANPFDNFVGDYAINGKGKIIATGSATVEKNCIRFNFLNLTGLTVEIDTNSNAFTSNMLYLRNPKGWSGHPISDYSNGPLSYARTTGDSNLAQNEWIQGGTFGNQVHTELLKVSLRKNGANVLLEMVESYIENNTVLASCTYTAALNKK